MIVLNSMMLRTRSFKLFCLNFNVPYIYVRVYIYFFIRNYTVDSKGN